MLGGHPGAYHIVAHRISFHVILHEGIHQRFLTLQIDLRSNFGGFLQPFFDGFLRHDFLIDQRIAQRSANFRRIGLLAGSAHFENGIEPGLRNGDAIDRGHLGMGSRDKESRRGKNHSSYSGGDRG